MCAHRKCVCVYTCVQLWLTFIAVSLGTGVVYIFLEGPIQEEGETNRGAALFRLRNREEQKLLVHRISHTLYIALSQFTGADRFTPSTTVRACARARAQNTSPAWTDIRPVHR